MARRRFARKAQEWTEVARGLDVFWPCRCQYSNVASYRCYYCGKRAPVEVRTLVAETLQASARAEVPATGDSPLAVPVENDVAAATRQLAGRH